MKNLKVEKCRQEIIKKYYIIVDEDGIWNLSDIQHLGENTENVYLIDKDTIVLNCIS
jgi:hypothetical protein